MRKLLSLIGLILCCVFGASAQTVTPLGGLGNLQFFDNSGAPLTSGVLYVYVAGTSTQAATFTDSTGLIQNPNPVPFGTGARASIWLTTGQFFKLVLCSQNDGAFCAAADILFSADQVPGGSGAGGGGGGSPFVGVFVSSSASPATTGILELATGDTICWRNQSGSTNLCLSKNTNDLLSWAGGSILFPEVAAPSGVAAFDLLWADSTAHRWMMKNNGGAAAQIVASGADINTSDQVTKLHFGSTVTPLSSTPPTTNQFLQWNGSNIIGAPGPTLESAFSAYTRFSLGNIAPLTFHETVLAQSHTLKRFTVYVETAGVGCSTNSTVVFRDFTSSTNLATLSAVAGSGFYDSGALTVAMTAGDTFGFQLTVSAVGCSTFPADVNFTAVYQ